MASKAHALLKELSTTSGVHEALVVGRDGFVIEHVGDMDADGVGATVSTVIGTVEAMGKECGQGNMFELMAEYAQGTIIAAPCGKDAVLGLVADSTANLGAVRQAVKRGIRDLERAL